MFLIYKFFWKRITKKPHSIFRSINVLFVSSSLILIPKKVFSTPILLKPSPVKNKYKYSLYSLNLTDTFYIQKNQQLRTLNTNPRNLFLSLKKNQNPTTSLRYLFRFNWFYIFKYFNYFLLVTNAKLNLVFVKIFYLLTSSSASSTNFTMHNKNLIIYKKKIFYV